VGATNLRGVSREAPKGGLWGKNFPGRTFYRWEHTPKGGGEEKSPREESAGGKTPKKGLSWAAPERLPPGENRGLPLENIFCRGLCGEHSALLKRGGPQRPFKKGGGAPKI